jgi:hypothetical protein
VTLAELSAGLVWPLLLRTPSLALRPPRVVMGMLVMLALWGGGAALDWGLSKGRIEPVASPLVWGIRDGWMTASEQTLDLEPRLALRTLSEATFGQTVTLLTYRPLPALAALFVLIPILAVGSGAIARSVAVDSAVGLNLGVRESLSFGMSWWRTLIGALAVPLALVGVGVAALKIAGWLLLGIPYLNVVGAVFYWVFLGVGLAVNLLLIGFILGQSMLAPAVAVEGSDSIDAIQRVYAYLMGRPGRALLYLAIAVAQGLLAIGIAAWLVNGAALLTAELSGSFLPLDRSRSLFEPGLQDGAAGWIIGFWQLMVALLLSGVMISWQATAGTLVYLLLRRVCDEQDVREVWMPGVVGGTRAGAET